MIYLDTSALLKLYIRENGSSRVQELISQQDDPLPLTDILEMELTNALRLKVYWQEITVAQADEQLAFLADRKRRGLYVVPEVSRAALMATFRNLSSLTPELGCRTMDILHVAWAKQLQVTSFISFDQRQIALAQRAALKVVILT